MFFWRQINIFIIIIIIKLYSNYSIIKMTWPERMQDRRFLAEQAGEREIEREELLVRIADLQHCLRYT